MKTTTSQHLARGTLVLGGIGLAGATVWWLRRQVTRRRYGRLPPARVVVLGAGFGGLAAATELTRVSRIAGSPHVTVVDQHNYHLFTPLLYQVSTGSVEPGSITYPARSIGRDRGFEFRESTVTGIDFTSKRVLLDDGELPYDYLVIALGSVSNFFGMTDVAQHALPLKSVADALVIHNRVIDRFEQAAIEPDPGRRRRLLTFAVAGGGATGVELVASLKELIFDSLLHEYPMLQPSDVRLLLVEARDQILSGWDRRLAELARRRLEEQNIEVWTNTAVTHATESSIETRDGRVLPVGMLVWTAGIRAHPIVETLPVQRERGGFIVVEPDLRVRGQDLVFAIGDIAFARQPETSRPFAWNAPTAIAMGKTVGQNILRLIAGQPTEPFHYTSKGELISLGRWTAAADLFGMVFDGFPAWVTRRTVYLLNLISFRNRLTVAIDWAFALAGRRNTARFDLEPTRVAVPEQLRRAG